MKQNGTDRQKPCADCGSSTVAQGAKADTAADSYDRFVELGLDEDTASMLVDSGVRIADGVSQVDVLALAVAALSERVKSAEEALDATELELEKKEALYEDLEEQYNVMAESFEGNASSVALPDNEDG